MCIYTSQRYKLCRLFSDVALFPFWSAVNESADVLLLFDLMSRKLFFQNVCVSLGLLGQAAIYIFLFCL
jgi:hypothetical protein